MSPDEHHGTARTASELRRGGRRNGSPDAASETRALSVAVCVVTYRRPRGLARLLAALGDLVFSNGVGAELRILVMDNDPGGSAEPVCREAERRLTCPIDYRQEPVRGIAAARNSAIRAVWSDADFIAFIDDDEVPEPRWLEELLRVQREYAADVVAGPVLRNFEDPVPAWIRKGRFFDLPRYATGERLNRAYTGNVLVRTQVFRAMESLFDERLSLSGGEDTHFFLRVGRAGYAMVWADEATVHELVPPSRVKARWLLGRAFRNGNVWSTWEPSLQPFMDPVRAVGAIAKGVVRLPLASLAGRSGAMAEVLRIAMGLGYLAGMLGYLYEEYSVSHGA